MAVSPNEQYVTTINKDNEPTCWGCGLHLVLPSYTPTFKCGWCGAITSPNSQKHESKWFKWRRLRDRCFVCVLFGFMGFVICGGVWAVYPVVFSISYFCGIFHSVITICLSVSTLSMFCLAAFHCPGTPPIVLWGNYPLVGKGDLENYTFCHYCSKPKSPRTHHCRSCGMCVLDMDHHCPFISLNDQKLLVCNGVFIFLSYMIGNCVGAANHRYFILFLISAVVSTIYVAIMSVTAGLHIWSPLSIRPHAHANVGGTDLAMRFVKEIVIALLNSALLMSSRGLLLVYLFVSSISVNLGLSVLLWQQLFYIYEGKTYLSHLSSQGGDGADQKDCQNILRFFGCPYSVSRYLPVVRDSEKRHTK